MPLLRNLEAKLIRWEPRPPTPEARALNGQWPADHIIDWFIPVDALADAHGIQFICPKGAANNDFHMVQVFFTYAAVPARLGVNKEGRAVRWTVTGSGIDDLTLRPSIQEEGGGCNWHGFVTGGKAE